MEQYLIVYILMMLFEDDIDALLPGEEGGGGRVLYLRVVRVEWVEFEVVHCRQSLFLAAVDEMHLYLIRLTIYRITHQLLRMNCKAAIEMKTRMMKKVRSMSSMYPITPITLSGIRSKGIRMQTITKKNMRSRCTLRMKYTKNWGLNTNFFILYKTQGSSINLLIRGRLSSKRMLQSLSFCSSAYVSWVCQKSLNSTFISWRQSGHFIFQCCRSQREKMHSAQKEWPQVEETGLSFGYPKQMEQTQSLACLSLLSRSSSFQSMRTSSDICRRTYSLMQVQLQAISDATAMKGSERAIITYEPTAYMITMILIY